MGALKLQKRKEEPRNQDQEIHLGVNEEIEKEAKAMTANEEIHVVLKNQKLSDCLLNLFFILLLLL